MIHIITITDIIIIHIGIIIILIYLNIIKDMEIIQGTSILAGVVVGLVLALIGNIIDQKLNQRHQPDYHNDIKEEEKNKNNE